MSDFRSAGDDDRDGLLARYRVVYTPPEPAFDDLAALAAHLCGTAGAAISFFTGAGQWLKASVGLRLAELPLDARMLRMLAAEPVGFEIPDVLIEGGNLSARMPGIRYYAGVPIRSPNGHILGVLAVADGQPRRRAATPREALPILSRQVTTILELRMLHAANAPWPAPEPWDQGGAADVRALEARLLAAARAAAMEALARGLGHDLRNPLGIIAGAAQLAQAHLDDAELVALCMRQIHSATMRAAAVIDTVLDGSMLREDNLEPAQVVSRES